MEQTLESLAPQLTMVCADLVQFPITYYFSDSGGRSALSAEALYLLELAEALDRPQSPASLCLRASMLREGCGDLASIVGARFLGMPQAPADEVLEAFAADHRREPVTRGAGE